MVMVEFDNPERHAVRPRTDLIVGLKWFRSVDVAALGARLDRLGSDEDHMSGGGRYPPTGVRFGASIPTDSPRTAGRVWNAVSGPGVDSVDAV